MATLAPWCNPKDYRVLEQTIMTVPIDMARAALNVKDFCVARVGPTANIGGKILGYVVCGADVRAKGEPVDVGMFLEVVGGNQARNLLQD